MSVASSDQFGQVVTVATLSPVSQLVRNIMFQDNDLSAWIARKSVSYFKSIVETAMPDSFDRNYETALAGVGLRAPRGVDVQLVDSAVELEDSQRDAALALANVTLCVLRALTFSRPDERVASDWRFYSSLYTGEGLEDAEDIGYDITAWTSVVVARLLTTGRIVAPVPVLQPEYRDVPTMDAAGWYPNPPNYGGTDSGDARFQRLWNGQKWTDQVRMRDGRHWETGVLSLHEEPTD